MPNQTFELNVTINDSHVDALGHVNNVVYLQWAEMLAWQHSQHLGLGLLQYQQLDAAMVAHEHVLTYLAPCFTGQTLQLQTWLGQRSSVKMRRHYQFVRLSDNKNMFTGHTDWVCVRLSTGKVQKMPLPFLQGYQVSAYLALQNQTQ